MIRRPPRSTLSSSSAASDVYKRQLRVPYLESQALLVSESELHEEHKLKSKALNETMQKAKKELSGVKRRLDAGGATVNDLTEAEATKKLVEQQVGDHNKVAESHKKELKRIKAEATKLSKNFDKQSSIVATLEIDATTSSNALTASKGRLKEAEQEESTASRWILTSNSRLKALSIQAKKHYEEHARDQAQARLDRAQRNFDEGSWENSLLRVHRGFSQTAGVVRVVGDGIKPEPDVVVVCGSQVYSTVPMAEFI
eukprot:TRINITY_DN29996_c0_g1_i1.p1 TRINITY_DN29996_c0_g1~~TRINITY_DN29996_c0_g1_i1.p1  ORF type:complete len:256 (+),score=106.65 TRINITY_DN29996_c0_g1_i1:131-898(+)